MNVHILEMPLDYGGRRHGSDMGPSAIRLAGLREKIESLGHNVFVNKKGFNIVAQEYADAAGNLRDPSSIIRIPNQVGTWEVEWDSGGGPDPGPGPGPGPGPWPTGKLPIWLLFKMAKGGRLL